MLVVICCTCLGIANLEFTIGKYLLMFGFGGTAATYTITNATAWARIFGTEHLGQIKGYGNILVYFLSGISALCFTQIKERTGSYQLMGYIILSLIGVAFIFIIFDKTEEG